MSSFEAVVTAVREEGMSLRQQLVDQAPEQESPAVRDAKDAENAATQEKQVDLLEKIGIYNYFEYVAGSNTFDYCKPDPRHITSVIEILGGDIKKSLMVGDSETDANAAKAASIPVILLENGYTEKNTNEIYHNHLIKDFIGVEKIVSTYLKD